MSVAPSETQPTDDVNSLTVASDRPPAAVLSSPAQHRSAAPPMKGRSVTLQAQCHHCNEAFELSQLYGADPCDANRCPACAVHLGPSGLGHITFRIERHLKALDQSLRDLADHPGAFTVDSTIVRSQVLASIDQLDDPPPLNTSTRVVPAAPH